MEHGQDVKCLAWHPHEEVSHCLTSHEQSQDSRRGWKIRSHCQRRIEADRQILASASYDSHIHLMYDDPDSDWLCFQKLHPKLPQTPITLSSSSPLVPAIFPSRDEQEAEEAINLPPLEEDETVWSLAWAPGGQYLASAGDNGGIRIWSRE